MSTEDWLKREVESLSKKIYKNIYDDILKSLVKKIKFCKLHPDAVTPTRATDGSAGFDLTAINTQFDSAMLNGEDCFTDSVCYGTGLAFEIPKGHFAMLCARSSCWKHGMTLVNGVGIIDSDFRGEVKARFWYQRSKGFPGYHDGDRIAQLVFMPFQEVELIEVDELTKTQRGSGGFGSTGQ